MVEQDPAFPTRVLRGPNQYDDSSPDRGCGGQDALCRRKLGPILPPQRSTVGLGLLGSVLGAAGVLVPSD